MTVIKIPNNNLNERRYILDIIFNEFLGIEYSLDIGSTDYEITLPNKKALTIKDTFFNRYPKDLEYLKLENIPKKIEELDIFSASFFMLARWEEYVNKSRDNHNRFPATESLSYKQGFLDRPVVNEYVEWLKQELLKLDSNLQFKDRKFELILTHDVDTPLLHSSFLHHIKASILDIIQRKNIKLLINRNANYLKIKLFNKQDPFDTFDYIMTLSEKAGLKSYFFFMAKGNSPYDNMYKSSDKFIRKLIQNIKKRGHFIGIHPTYSAYNDSVQFKREKEELEKNLDSKIIFGREHYLRFDVPTTWQIWEDNKMEWDSTLSYADKEGFRCGVCYPYSVFNILTREKLNLKERPLIVMEGSFTTYQPNIPPKEMKEKIYSLIEQVKKYNGEFVLLWHNSSFNTDEWKRYKMVYESIVK